MDRHEKYGRLTVTQLKALLREREASLKGKEDLIERLIFYDQNNNFQLNPALNFDYEAPTEFACDLLNAAKNNPEQSNFFNWEVVDRFSRFGGVRIEADVLITETGVENLTIVPRTVAEIEEFMANGANFK